MSGGRGGGWVPLHLKSHYSLGLGTSSVDELTGRLEEDGVTCAGLCDEDTLQGQVRFRQACRARGIRPLPGVELTGAARVLLLPRDRDGYSRMCRIVTRRAERRNADGGLPGDRDVLRTLAATGAEGLFVLTDAPSLARRMMEEGLLGPEDLRMLLVRPMPRRPESEVLTAARELGVPLVADPAPLFADPADRPLHLLLRAVREGHALRRVREEDGGRSRGRHLPRPGEVRRRYADVPEAVDETCRVAERCRSELGPGELPPPSPPEVDAGSAPTVLAERVRRRLERSRASGRCLGARYTQRLEEELRVIAGRELSGYFLVVGEILGAAREKGIPVAGRGSAVGSLVGHLLGLSPVDPVEAGLYFQRFVHARRRDLPDVDIDVSSPRRDELIDWVHGRFGRDRVAMASAVHRFRKRSAVREGRKALGGREAPELLQRLVGRPRHVALHPGGVVVAPLPLRQVIPLQPAGGGRRVTQLDADGLEELELVKIDLLGSRSLAEVETAVSLLGRSGELEELGARLRKHGTSILPTEDAPTLALLDRGATVGIGQIETPAVRAVLEQVPVRGMADLTAVLAVVRPGAAAGRAKERFIRNAREARSTEPRGSAGDPLAEPRESAEDPLDETHGVLLYEEDIIRILSEAGGLDLEEADELRREVLAHEEQTAALRRLEEGFLRRARWSGTPSGRARAVWRDVVRFASYSFNKAHASSYARLAYESAYLRRHAPVAFACGVLEHHGGAYPLRTVAAEVERWGVRVLPPHVARSDAATGPEAVGAVRLGLSRIKGLTRRTGARILASRRREGPFRDLEDLLARAAPGAGELKALVLVGACDGLDPLERQGFPFVHEELAGAFGRGGEVKEAVGAAASAPAGDRISPAGERYRTLVRIRYELRFLEMHPSAHPMDVLRPDAEALDCVTTAQAREAVGSRVRVAALLAAARRVPLSRGRTLRFLTLEDEEGLLEAVLQPPGYRELDPAITTPGPYLFHGRMQGERGHVQLEIDDLVPFHARHRKRVP